jgi:hypothetical protein
LQTPRLPAENSLRLLVEPPSPDTDAGERIAARRHTSRLQDMSRTLRSRKNRWIDRTSYDGSSQQENYKDILAPSTKPRRRTPGLPQQSSNVVDANNVDNPEGGDRSSNRHSDLPLQRSTQLGLECELDDEDAQTTVCKRADEHVTANKSFLFQAWLWFQFTIVVLFFIFAMARKGPGSVLVGSEGVRKERKVVSRR